jgi:hypothetical protein
MNDRNLLFHVNHRDRVPGRALLRRWHLIIWFLTSAVGFGLFFYKWMSIGNVVLFLGFAIPLALYSRDQRRLRRAAVSSRFLACPNCLYDRRFDQSDNCPECNFDWPRTRITREWLWFTDQCRRKRHPGYIKLRTILDIQRRPR